jgi:hypothetical protein
VETIHRLSNPIERITPQDEILEDNFPIMLAINSIKPEPNTLKTTWYLNKEIIATNTDTIILNEEIFPDGLSIISFNMEDTTDMLRIDAHAEIHSFQVFWELNRTTTSVEVINNDVYEINISPNPTQDFVEIQFMESPKQDYEITLFNLSGKLYRKDRFFGNKKRVDLQNLPSGPYILNIKAEDQMIFSKKIYKF